jgi:acetamidase/formamidase
MSHALAEQIGEGDKVFTRISQIAGAARSAEPHREPLPAADPYAVQPQTAPVQHANGYAVPESAPSRQAPAVEPERKRGSRASDIRSAAAEATARLEEFRNKRKGAAA